MYSFPDMGIITSSTKHNCNIEIFCDWLEGAVLFSKDRTISQSDIVDRLKEENIYQSQDFAYEFIENCWSEIENRQKVFGKNKIYKIKKNEISRDKKTNWKDVPSYSFCLSISLRTYYNVKPILSSNFFNVQGELFEKLVEESLNVQFPDWQLMRTGWSNVNKTKLSELVEKIGEFLNVPVRQTFEKYVHKNANDAQLDLILSKPFLDNYCLIPIFLFQCASGENWVRKKGEPNLTLWNELLEFNSKINKGFAIPFSLSKDEFIKNSTSIDGFFLDRKRLNECYAIKKDWISPRIKRELNKFSEKIIKNFPKI